MQCVDHTNTTFKVQKQACMGDICDTKYIKLAVIDVSSGKW